MHTSWLAWALVVFLLLTGGGIMWSEWRRHR
jgi:cytochrome c-type biogenesis protein CcmH/NrfF